jgi:hypothetical protein
MASQDCGTKPQIDPIFSSSFSYWNEVAKGDILDPYWHRQYLSAVQPNDTADVRAGGLPDRRKP